MAGRLGGALAHTCRTAAALCAACAVIFACVFPAFADEVRVVRGPEVSDAVTQLIARAVIRCEEAPVNLAKQPASLQMADVVSRQAERDAASQYAQRLRDREQQVAAQLALVAPEYLEIEALGPLPEPAYYEFESVYQVDDASANEDGTLGWWQDNWYTAHDWSEIGEQIAAMRPGDVVVIDGYPITVEGKFIWPQESTYMEIMRRVGWGATVLQTCLGDDQNIWIVYGR